MTEKLIHEVTIEMNPIFNPEFAELQVRAEFVNRLRNFILTLTDEGISFPPQLFGDKYGDDQFKVVFEGQINSPSESDKIQNRLSSQVVKLYDFLGFVNGLTYSSHLYVKMN